MSFGAYRSEMKHFMQPRNTILKEAQTNELGLSSTPSQKQKLQQSPSSVRRQKPAKENANPTDMNVSQPDQKQSHSPVSKTKNSLPPRPPLSNPLKRKLSLETTPDNAASDSGVQVVVRMRPLNRDEEGEKTVQKLSDNSLLINGHTFTFDSVADTAATQLDVFQLIGAPLVENCLAGFNSSVFAYGQTGSGKTYTMWGPANALLNEKFSCEMQGLTPRVFERLFARIEEEQIKHADKQLKFQCRCSFLEIYNEQIMDLLDPNQRNLQIREDVKSGVYVENLKEELVSTVKDVIQLLVKGLSNRRTGSTSINAESSRSHSVFTCVLESRCKCLSDGMSSLKTSRINLVDLAGSERQKSSGTTGERLKEAGNINRSLSQLGNLINILAEVSQTGKQRHIPYRDSKLTFLLQESLGGNAKLAVVCAISPAQSCKSETFSTLRFAHRAKAINNKAVVNEEVETDVNQLREVIRQLRNELHKVKANSNNTTGWDRRKSLILLKSLINPMPSVRVDEDGDEEMEVDDEAVESSLCFESPGPQMAGSNIGGSPNGNRHLCKPPTDAGVKTEDGFLGSREEQEHYSSATNLPLEVSLNNTGAADPSHPPSHSPNRSFESTSPPTVLKSPTKSASPKMSHGSRKSMRTSLRVTASQKSAGANSCSSPENPHPTADPLVASLHRGLEIIESHSRSSVLRRSSFVFPQKLAEPKLVDKVDVGVQTLLFDDDAKREHEKFVCSLCQNRKDEESNGNDRSDLQLVPVEGSPPLDRSRKQVPKVVEKVLAGSIRREMALEDRCSKQAYEIAQFDRLVQQYRHERECNSIIAQTREDKIARLEGLLDNVLSADEFRDQELASLSHELNILKEKYENHPEVLRANIELRNVKNELEQFQNFYDLGEKQVLMEEIQDLKCHLQYYIDSSSSFVYRRGSVLHLTRLGEPSPTSLTVIPESAEENIEKRLEEERRQWTEAESKWISLAEELRSELEASRNAAEKWKRELDAEKKCASELKEAMQVAMEGHARMLEQYADLEEKHMQLLLRHRKIQDGVDDVKKAASKAGVKGVESKFINALAAGISALKVEKERERRYLREENKEMKAQLRDTAEAVQAAGELLSRLRDAEEAVAVAQSRALAAEEEAANAYAKMNKLKRKHENEMTAMKEMLAESRLPKEAILARDLAKYDDPNETPTQQGDDFELSKFSQPVSWFSEYDRCNI